MSQTGHEKGRKETRQPKRIGRIWIRKHIKQGVAGGGPKFFMPMLQLNKGET
jgi:hypothetical protein